MSTTVKRYRVRLQAVEPTGIQRAVGHRLGPESMRMRLSAPPNVDTPVEVRICYADGGLALLGRGWVSEVQGDETYLEVEWDPTSDRALLHLLFGKDAQAPTPLSLNDLESPDEVQLVPSETPSISDRLHPDLDWALARPIPGSPEEASTDELLSPPPSPSESNIEFLEDPEPSASTDGASSGPSATPGGEDASGPYPAPQPGVEYPAGPHATSAGDHPSGPVEAPQDGDQHPPEPYGDHPPEPYAAPHEFVDHRSGPYPAPDGGIFSSLPYDTTSSEAAEPTPAVDDHAAALDLYRDETPIALTDVVEQAQADIEAQDEEDPWLRIGDSQVDAEDNDPWASSDLGWSGENKADRDRAEMHSAAKGLIAPEELSEAAAIPRGSSNTWALPEEAHRASAPSRPGSNTWSLPDEDDPILEPSEPRLRQDAWRAGEALQESMASAAGDQDWSPRKAPRSTKELPPLKRQPVGEFAALENSSSDDIDTGELQMETLAALSSAVQSRLPPGIPPDPGFPPLSSISADLAAFEAPTDRTRKPQRLEESAPVDAQDWTARPPTHGWLTREEADAPALNGQHALDDAGPTAPLGESPTASLDPESNPWLDKVTPLARIDLVRQEIDGNEAEGGQISSDPAFEHAEPEPLPREGQPAPRSAPMGPILAIDIGTSMTTVAVALQDGASLIAPEIKADALPSVVVLEPGGRTLAGAPALRALAHHPTWGVVGAKRLLGRSYWAPTVRRVEAQLTWTPTPGPRGQVAARVDRRCLSLEEIVALLLRRAVRNATQLLEAESNRVILTCPAYYGLRQRAALTKAAELAGLHVERLVSCNIAAAVQHLRHAEPGPRRKYLVFDFGAGTLDVSVVESDGRTFVSLAAGGHALLGGLDFDAAVVHLLVKSIEGTNGHVAEGGAASVEHLLNAAEGGKQALDEISRVHLPVPPTSDARPHSMSNGAHHSVEVSRDDAEALWATLVDKALSITRDVCRRAGVAPMEIDEILVTGGQTRAPYVSRRLTDFFKKPCVAVEGDGPVALGAAEIARRLALKEDGFEVIDCLPTSFALGLPGGAVQQIVPRDAPMPARAECEVELAPNAPPELLFFEGDHARVEGCEPYGRLKLESIPEGRAVGHGLILGVRVDARGQVEFQLTGSTSGSYIPHRLDEVLSDAHVAKVLAAPAKDELEPEPEPGGGFLNWLSKKFRR